MKKAYVIHGIPSKEPICELLEFQKKRGKREVERLFKEIMVVEKNGERFGFPSSCTS